MIDCIVDSPLRFDGKRHKPGASISLPVDLANELERDRIVFFDDSSNDSQTDPELVKALVEIVKSGNDPLVMRVKDVNATFGGKAKKADIEAALQDGSVHAAAIASLQEVEGVAGVVEHISNQGDAVIGADGLIDPQLVTASYSDNPPAEPIIKTAIIPKTLGNAGFGYNFSLLILALIRKPAPTFRVQGVYRYQPDRRSGRPGLIHARAFDPDL